MVMYDINDGSVWTKLEYSLRKLPTLPYPECKCNEGHHVANSRDFNAVIEKCGAHPVANKMFTTMDQPCFMCQIDDRMPGSSFAIDAFSFEELFGELPHPETLNLYFVGHSN